MKDAIDHISDAALEEYSLDKFAEWRFAELKEHLQACDDCRARLGGIQPLSFIHFTEDGPIYSSATRLRTGKVMARHWGKELDGGRECKSLSAAKRYLNKSFSEMFPEHTCNGTCGPAKCARTRENASEAPFD